MKYNPTRVQFTHPTQFTDGTPFGAGDYAGTEFAFSASGGPLTPTVSVPVAFGTGTGTVPLSDLDLPQGVSLVLAARTVAANGAELWSPPGGAVSGLAWAGLVLAGALAVWPIVQKRPHVLPLVLLLAPLLPVAGAALLESGVRFAERSLALPVPGLAIAAVTFAGRAPRRLAAAAYAALWLWIAAQAAVAWPAIGAWRDGSPFICSLLYGSCES